MSPVCINGVMNNMAWGLKNLTNNYIRKFHKKLDDYCTTKYFDMSPV